MYLGVFNNSKKREQGLAAGIEGGGTQVGAWQGEGSNSHLQERKSIWSDSWGSGASTESDKISFFLLLNNIPLCMCIYTHTYTHIHIYSLSMHLFMDT